MPSEEAFLKMSVKPVHVTDSNFEEIIKKYPLVLVDFCAAWCPPCVTISPIIEELAEEYNGKVLVGKLNVDENPRTAERFAIFSIPTLLLVKDGKEVDRIIGFAPKIYIKSRLEKYLR